MQSSRHAMIRQKNDMQPWEQLFSECALVPPSRRRVAFFLCPRYFWIFLGVIWLCTACALRNPSTQENDAAPSLPEVRKVTFVGNSNFTSRALRKVMATTPRPLWPPWKRGEPYNPPTLEADLVRLKKFYFDRGYLNTTVRLGEVVEDTEQHSVEIILNIEEGLPTLLTALHLAGEVSGDIPPDAATLDDLALRPGKVLTKEAFDASKALLLKQLHDAGYARAQVIPHTEVDPQAHTASVTFTREPGQLTTFGPTAITGEQQVEEQAIRRQLRFHEGERYSEEALTMSTDAIYGLGMFRAVTPRARNLDDLEAPLAIDIEVTERPPRSFQFGFGYSTVERFRGQVQWLHRNVLGGAEQLKLSTSISSIEQNFEASFFLPYFFNRRFSLTTTLFVRNEQEIYGGGFLDNVFNIRQAQPAFDLLSFGGEIRLGIRLSRTLSGATGVLLSSNDFRNIDPTALNELQAEVTQDNLLFIQFGEIQWNTSNNLLNPTRGFILRGRGEHANAAILSDVSFAKLLVEGRYYYPLFDDIIVASRLKVGSIWPYGTSTEVPFNVRFFAGGPGSVRGFALNRLGPLDTDDNPIGGNSVLEGSVEVRFPIAGAFGGAAFLDFGNVFPDAFSYDLADLRYVIGPGIRYNTPVGPIRLDVGILLDRRPNESYGRIEFSIGQAF